MKAGSCAYVQQKLKQIESIWLSPAAARASAGLGLRGERGMRAISRAAFAQCQSSISVGSPPQCRATYNLTPMSVSGTVTISSTAWNSMITRFAKRIGTILMIVPARVAEERPSEHWQTIQLGRRGRPRRQPAGSTRPRAGRPASSRTARSNSSANFVNIFGLLQYRLICSGRKCLLAAGCVNDLPRLRYHRNHESILKLLGSALETLPGYLSSFRGK